MRKTKLMTPFGEADLAKRRSMDGYNHWLEQSFINPEMIHGVIKREEKWIEQLAKGEVEQLPNREILKWIDEHFTAEGLDPLNIDQISEEVNIFNSMSKFMFAMRAILLPGKPPNKIEQDELMSTGRLTSTMWWHLYAIWKHGERLFNVSKGLSDKLFLTDIKGLTWDNIRLPFPGLVMQVPSYLIQLEAVRTGWHKLDTALVSEGYDKSGRIISVFFMGQENEKSSTAGDDASYYVNLYESEGPLVSDSLFMSLSNRKGLTALADLVKIENDTGIGSLARAINFVINVLVYINSTGDVERMPWSQRWQKLKEKSKRLTGRKRKNAQAKMREIEQGFVRAYVVGQSIPVDPRLSSITQSVGRRQSPSVASYVRGHWRNQAHGPGRELRKLLWIQPHWRNVGAEKPGERKYEVK